MVGPTSSERLAVVRLQVADACDRDGQVFCYCFATGRYQYIAWHEAIDMLLENTGSLADPPGVFRSPFERMD